MQADIRTWIQKIDNSVVRDNILDACTAEMGNQIRKGNFNESANAAAINAFRQMGDQQYAPSVMSENTSKNIIIYNDDTFNLYIMEYARNLNKSKESSKKIKIWGAVAAVVALIGLHLFHYGPLGAIYGSAFLLIAGLIASMIPDWLSESSHNMVSSNLNLEKIAYQHVARAKRCLIQGVIQMEQRQRPDDRIQEYKQKVLECFTLNGDIQAAEREVADLNLAFIGPS